MKTQIQIQNESRSTGEDKNWLQGKDLSSQEQFGRAETPLINEEADNFKFMQIDVDYYTEKADQLPNYLPLRKSDEYAVLRMYGVTEGGNSVLAHIHQFLSYLYVEIAPDYQDTEFTPKDLENFKLSLNQRMAQQQNQYGNNRFSQQDVVAHIEIQEKASVMFYQEKLSKFMKIFVSIPRNVSQLRQSFEKGDFSYNGKYQFFGSTTYESNLPFPLRFMIDNDIVGMQWIQILAGKYILRRPGQKVSTCQFEFDVVDFGDIQSIPLKLESKIAPIRILSFDIECSAQKGRFPTPDKDPVIQIANIVKVLGESEPIVRNVFTLKSCAQIVGTKIYSFEKESDLLSAWRDFVSQVDPDFITGYNTQNFDIPYIIDRANHLMISNYARLGRLKNVVSKPKDQTSNIKALGMREGKDTNIEGRVQLDMMQVVIRDHKLRSYSLNSVSYHFLNEQKEDVPHQIISELQNQDEFTRRRLAIYCVKDAYLPLRLLEKLMCLFNLTEMARVTGVPISYLFSRGQQIKVASQIYRKAKTMDLIIPTKRVESTGEKFEGAIVIDPKRGYYTHPIATLDFASLYPSIMMAHNLCYTTLVPSEKEAMKFSPDQIQKTPNGDWFIRKEVKKGILPMILEELIGARKQAKKDLKAATDPFERGVLDGRQLALKISANSVYGFTGAQVGQLPCLPISSSVTAFGREMIELTQASVIEQYSKKNGYEFDSDVIYGDTDSVMVKFGTEDRAEAMRLGEEAAAFVSKKFVSPIKLEFEKIYHPYLLMNKKRYAGMYWTNPIKPDKMDAKGIETVRRDSCSLVQNIVQGSLDILLLEFNKEKAVEHCKGLISDLLQNRIDLSLLVITKGLSKKIGDDNDDDDKPKGNDKNTYANKSSHTELARKMKERDAASAPQVGDRVAYVMVKGLKGSKGYQNSEDPIYVLNNNLPIDYNYYIENQLKKPLIRIFEPIFNDEKRAERELFTGDHMRNVYQPKVNVTKGLGMFAQVKASCISCKCVLPPKYDDALCQNCQPKKKGIYIERKLELNKAEKVYGDLWVQCQRCQSSLHQDILCKSRDCPIFYRRVKAKKNYEELGDQMAKLDEW